MKTAHKLSVLLLFLVPLAALADSWGGRSACFSVGDPAPTVCQLIFGVNETGCEIKTQSENSITGKAAGCAWTATPNNSTRGPTGYEVQIAFSAMNPDQFTAYKITSVVNGSYQTCWTITGATDPAACLVTPSNPSSPQQ